MKAATNKPVFVEFLGNAALNGRSILVEKVGELYMVSVTGRSTKRVPGFKVLKITSEKLEVLKEKWFDGLFCHDVRVIERAMQELQA